MKAKPLSDEEIEGRRMEAERMRGICDDADIYRWIATIESKDRLIKVREEAAQDLKAKLDELRHGLNPTIHELLNDNKKLKEENEKLRRACEVLAVKEPIDVGSKNFNAIMARVTE
jgi:hypothetical protein